MDFEAAVLKGYADDGGLFVPESIPRVSAEKLKEWSSLGYVDLAFEVLSLFIARSVIPEDDLRRLLQTSYSRFEHPDILPVVTLDKKRGIKIMELFHGPTLSFKDIAMVFLINCMDYFLKRSGKHASLLIATTGDTGPAAAYASAGKESIECWVLYPRGLITEEQERQMTTLDAPNVHPVAVENCPDGGDNLDMVIAELFADDQFRERVGLSSVNSINWCRVMVQAVNFFYGYFRSVDSMGQKVTFSVPSGAFGNLFGGYLARTMGLPVENFICANNENTTLHEAFSSGNFNRKGVIQTVSSALDIGYPYNFWRLLYFTSGQNPEKIRQWMADFDTKGVACLDEETRNEVVRGFTSTSISDEQTLATISDVYRTEDGYLLDPHAAVAVAAYAKLAPTLEEPGTIVCMATAHPAKFPNVIRKALGAHEPFPPSALHHSIEAAKGVFHHMRVCDCKDLKSALIQAMSSAASQSP